MVVKVHFEPGQQSFEGEGPTKVLVAARRAQTEIRFGCASCLCGTCAVRIISLNGELSAMRSNEKALLEKMSLPVDGSIRLSCQARIVSGELTVDLSFQNEYSPDSGISP